MIQEIMGDTMYGNYAESVKEALANHSGLVLVIVVCLCGLFVVRVLATNILAFVLRCRARRRWELFVVNSYNTYGVSASADFSSVILSAYTIDSWAETLTYLSSLFVGAVNHNLLVYRGLSLQLTLRGIYVHRGSRLVYVYSCAGHVEINALSEAEREMLRAVVVTLQCVSRYMQAEIKGSSVSIEQVY